MTVPCSLRLILSGLALALLLGAQSGCLVAAAAGAGAATYAYASGELTAHVDAPVSEVGPAARAVFEEMGGMITTYEPGSVEAKIYARLPNDKRVEVLARPVTEKATKLNVRVGTFGDESLSRTVVEKIRAKLNPS
jgi:hypothetical protein